MNDTGARIRGVVSPLPAGETILWQGAPRWTLLARHALGVNWWIAYFAIIIAFGLFGALRDGATPAQVVGTLAMQVTLSTVAVGLIYAYAILTSRMTTYAITDRRIVLRIGIVLPTTVNLPLRLIESAAGRTYGDGSGEIALAIRKPDRLGYAHLWPHVRPWQLRDPQPMLRALDQHAEVTTILRDAVTKDEARHASTGSTRNADGAAATQGQRT